MTESNIEKHVKGRKEVIESSLYQKECLQLLKNDMRVAKIADVTNDVFNECLQKMLNEDNNL